MKNSLSLPMQAALWFLAFGSPGFAKEYPVKLAEPLKYHDELVEITEAGTLRPRYKVWGDYEGEVADTADTSLNNVLSLATESCALLNTATGHWLVVRPEVADVYVEMLSLRGKGAPLEAAGWINEGVCPLLVLRAPPELAVPAKEIGYFR